MELIWDGVPGIQFTKEEDVSRLCEDIFNDDEYFVLTDYFCFYIVLFTNDKLINTTLSKCTLKKLVSHLM